MDIILSDIDDYEYENINGIDIYTFESESRTEYKIEVYYDENQFVLYDLSYNKIIIEVYFSGTFIDWEQICKYLEDNDIYIMD